MGPMAWRVLALGATKAWAATSGTTLDHITAPGANAAGCASNGLPCAINPWRSLGPCWGLRQQLLQHLHNAFTRVAIPHLGYSALFPLASKQLVQGRC